MQVLLLAQAVEERSLLLQKRLPRRQEHRPADVQPDPLAVVSPGRVDDGAVPDALRRRPAGFGRGGGGGRGISRLVVFVVVVVIAVVAVVSAATLLRRHRSDVRGSPLFVRCSCHLKTVDKSIGLEGSEDVRLRPPSVCLAERTGSAHCPTSRHPREGYTTGGYPERTFKIKAYII